MDNIAAPPMLTSNSFFPPMLVSIAGIVSTCVAIFLYHFFVVKYCRRRRQRGGLNGDSGEVHLGVGLDPKLLETVPVMPYLLARKRDDFRVDQRECVVCLGEMEDGETVRLLPDCRHAFHVPCIDRWFVAHSNCPVCRSPVVFRDGDNESHGSSVNSPPEDAENNSDDHHAASSSSLSSSQMHSCGLLRHCASLVLPMERRPSQKRLKRSLSMDQSFVIVDMQMETEDDDDDQRRHCSSSSSKERLTRSISIRQFDIVPSKLVVSLSSRLRIGRPTEILPC
ncbi:PREDICTED: RING-H2 finger protein ATL52-like [Ipomoea nil]|uniref:RING-H2 finger protein ATL52-like n=1 Tax=Ipomoea nil TaxID=35883 RepID=UPI0009013A9E|nr:PREDICTED: RING-H2 finger protein ATL52-like [Ipomoea nil]